MSVVSIIDGGWVGGLAGFVHHAHVVRLLLVVWLYGLLLMFSISLRCCRFDLFDKWCHTQAKAAADEAAAKKKDDPSLMSDEEKAKVGARV